jgi:hypothetical protein
MFTKCNLNKSGEEHNANATICFISMINVCMGNQLERMDEKSSEIFSSFHGTGPQCIGTM